LITMFILCDLAICALTSWLALRLQFVAASQSDEQLQSTPTHWSRWSVSLPNEDYWLAEDRSRVFSFGLLGRATLMQGILCQLLLFVSQQTTFSSVRQQLAYSTRRYVFIGAAAVMLLASFLTTFYVWRTFARPPRQKQYALLGGSIGGDVDSPASHAGFGR